MKTCTSCGKTKPLSEFYRQSRRRKDGRRYTGERGGLGVLAECKPCFKARSWAGNLRRRYGLTPEEYDTLLARGCAICGTTEGRIVLDHNHRNGKVRAALCDPCNRGLGDFHDDPARMRAAAEYVERHEIPISRRG